MDGLLGTIGTAAAVFAGTNIDDVIVLTVLFLSSRAGGRPRPWQIVAGQYAGIAVLVAVSAVAALGLTVVPDEWAGLLGLVPLGLGLWSLAGALRAARSGQETAPAVASGLLSVAGVTVANGADNISVYTPVFRTIGVTSGLVTMVVFAVLTALWCAAGAWLGSHRKVAAAVERSGHWLVPAVFIVIGAVIVLESGVLGRLLAFG
ncbi:cadmium resistance transporter [Planomonospora sp. ID91781]|uniref:cadmium resistance transporter n=1 Tax=Planomonospora sp. ID91781 TaxID=2738135 RepID=UPI0018C35D31|nr:cadmium resistance transporter [Planomonospora sp. ID91781]MBG0820067.1 cadmium resistance transporter [Planomonospora sp. ID91781]